MWKYQTADELYHYGTQGMRWGIRRFFPGGNKGGSSKKKRGVSPDHAKINKLRKRKMSTLSNKQLQEIKKRRELEKDFRRLSPTKVAIGVALAGGTIAALSKYGDQSGKVKAGVKALRSDGAAIVRGMKNFRIR